jgi:hypothetical protein
MTRDVRKKIQKRKKRRKREGKRTLKNSKSAVKLFVISSIKIKRTMF